MKRSKKTRAKDARDLSSYISDRKELARRVFLALKPSEVKAMAPKFTKKLPMEDIQALCLEELISMSAKSLRSVLSEPTEEIVVLDSDREADDSTAPSSENEASDTDSSDSDESDDTVKSSEVSDDVMVIEDDSDREDTKVDIEHKQEIILIDESRNNSKTDDIPVTTRISNSRNEEDITDQYVDRIKKLDMLSAKLGQEIDKLSKKKDTTSCEFTNEYVNEMLSELTRIGSEISTEQMKTRKESAEQVRTNKTVDKTNNICDGRKAKRKGLINDKESQGTYTKQSKIAKSSLEKDQELTKQATHENTVPVNSTINRLIDKENEPKEEAVEKIVETTVCLLSDSDDSQDKLESELQHSIAESRKHKVLSKESQKKKQKYADMSGASSITVDKRRKPFSEQDIEIEIVVDGCPNLDNGDEAVRSRRGANPKNSRKNTNINKRDSKISSKSLANDTIQQIDEIRSKQPGKDNIDDITVLSSSGSDYSDNDRNLSGPEEGEIDSSSDEIESAEVSVISKNQVNKKGVVRITSKNVAVTNLIDKGNNKDNQAVDTSQETNSLRAKPCDDEPIERSNEEVSPQLRSTIIKITDSDRLLETNTNKIKSIAVKVPQAKENISIKVGDANIKTRVLSNESNIRHKEIDSITVVVKNVLEDESTNGNRIVKMTEDIKSVESVVVAVKNKDCGTEKTDSPNSSSEDRQDTSKITKTKDVLKPVDLKYVAKASDFVFVKPKDSGKPMLMARDSSSNEKTAKLHENIDKPSTLVYEQDMDILDIEYTELTDGIMDDVNNTTVLVDSSTGLVKINTVETNDVVILKTNCKEIDTENAANAKDSLEQCNDETTLDNRELSDRTENIINCIEPAIGIASKPVTDIEVVLENVNSVSKPTAFHQTFMRSKEPVVGEIMRPDLNNRESINATETLDVVESTKKIDCDRNVTNINYYNVEDTPLKEMDYYNVEAVKNELETVNFIEAAENEESLTVAVAVEKNDKLIETATEVEKYNTMNLESVTDHTQLDIMPSTEIISTDSRNLTLQQYNTEVIKTMIEIDPALTLSATKVTDRVNQSLEEGELDHIDDRCSPYLANPALASKALEDGELTDPSSSDVESVEIPEEIICISDEEPGKDIDATEPARKKLKNKKKRHKKHKIHENKHKNCTGKCKHKKQNKDVDTKISGVKQSDDDKSNVDYFEISSKSPKDILTEVDNSNPLHEVKNDIAIDTSGKHDPKPLGANLNVISDLSDIEITENVEVKSATTKLLSKTKDSSQKVIDMLSIEISSDESSDEPIFEDLDDLTAAIDGIESQQVAELRDSEHEGEVSNISWRDRYLDSKKVKKVLTTSNILNALRKKNKELKKKLLESKQADVRDVTPEPTLVTETTQNNIEEGSIEHYNTLQGSTKFVDPIPDPADAKSTERPPEETAQKEIDTTTSEEEVTREKTALQTNVGNSEGNITKEMKKDAKNLLKMYKKLLKYNDMSRRSDPNKKKVKKNKRKKDGTG